MFKQILEWGCCHVLELDTTLDMPHIYWGLTFLLKSYCYAVHPMFIVNSSLVYY